jgi:ferredoxin
VKEMVINIFVRGEIGSFPGMCGENILKILRPLHKRCIVSGCRNGGCGICEIKILEGDYFAGVASTKRAYSASNEISLLACKTYALSDLLVEIVKPIQRNKSALFCYINR